MSGFFHPRWLASVLALLLVLLPGTARCAPADDLPDSPEPYYIRDDAGWLGQDAFQRLDSRLKDFEREGSSQIVVAILPRVPEGAELVDYSQRLFDKWKPGQAKEDNGAIFLIFAADRKMRIHTGYGMEGVLPDARCKQIIQDVVAPLLRQGQREEAIGAGVEAMIAAAKGEYKGDGTTRLDGQGQGRDGDWLLFLLMAFIIAGIIFPRFFGMADVIFTPRGRSRTGGDIWWGGPPGGGGWGGGGGSGGGFGGGGGFSGGGGSSGGGGASGSW